MLVIWLTLLLKGRSFSMFSDCLNSLDCELQTFLFYISIEVSCAVVLSSLLYLNSVDSVMPCNYTARHVRVTPVAGFMQNEMTVTLKFFRLIV